jgi:hypothetical protein
MIYNIQTDIARGIMLKYVWENGNSSENVNNWTYDSITIRLSRRSIVKLVDAIDVIGFGDELIEDSWDWTIKSFIQQFNSFKLHNKINAYLVNTDVKEQLSENMISVSDLIRILPTTSPEASKVRYVCVCILKELGDVIILTDWYVDYSKKSISMNIRDNAIYDLEIDEFISDSDTIRRVRNKLEKYKEYLVRTIGFNL